MLKHRLRATLNSVYWYIDDCGEINEAYERNDKISDYRWQSGNYFMTKLETKEYRAKLVLQQAYKDWCAFDIDWDDNEQSKCFACYPYTDDIAMIINENIKIQGTTYAESTNRITSFIDIIGADNFRKYILEVN